MNRSVKGLLIKDLRLILSQMKMFIVILPVYGGIMAISVKENFFFVAYAAVLCFFLALSTFSYDELDNGAAYIFTLPIRRNDYVFAKYLLGALMTVVPAVAIAFIFCVVGIAMGDGKNLLYYFDAVLSAAAIGFVLMAVEMPLYIKFGQEKSRIIQVVSIGIIVACLGLVGSLYAEADSAIGSILGLDSWILVLLMAAAVAVLVRVSYGISCSVLQKKQY